MASVAWYKTGTVTVTNGSTTVTGIGTVWLSGTTYIINVGDIFTVDGTKVYEVSAVNSATSITLASAYSGTTGTVGYGIIRILANTTTAQLANDVASLIAQYQANADAVLGGKFGDGTAGTPGAPQISFVGDTDTGVYRESANVIAFSTGGTKRLTIGPGIQVGNPTGGDKGAGAINAAGPIYVNNILVSGAASTTASGIVELATGAEALAGTDAVRALTPAGVLEAAPALTAPPTASPTTIAQVMVFAPDSYRRSVEGASGGHETVIYDDQGLPCVMVRIPAVTIGDLLTPLGLTSANAYFSSIWSDPHPAFVVGSGATKKGCFWMAKVPARIISGRAVCVPGTVPTVSVDFDTAKAACVAKGTGFHLANMWEWGLFQLLSAARSFEPRGNTNYGRSHENTLETSVRSDGLQPGYTTSGGICLSGQGPHAWNHDGSGDGVADLVGNISEWCGGMKMADGLLYYPSYNYYEQEEASWPLSSFALDSTVAGGSSGDVGDIVFNSSVTNRNGTAGDSNDTGAYSSNVWSATTKNSGLALSSNLAILALLGVVPITLFGGSYPSAAPKGSFYSRNYGTRLPFRGGGWGYGSTAGLGYLVLYYSRALSLSSLGFRPAFCS